MVFSGGGGGGGGFFIDFVIFLFCETKKKKIFPKYSDMTEFCQKFL